MNNALRHQNKETARTHTGFSLVEVLVVLVVLVIGILAIVRLFPAGFIALRNAQNSTFADRLGQAALESLKQGQGTLPDAVYMYTDGGFNPSVAPDDLYSYAPEAITGKNTSRQYGLLTGAYADINKQRYISNETVSVPAAHAVGDTPYPPLYAVAFGPIALPATTVPAAGGPLPSLTVNSVPWTPQSGDSRPDPNDPNSAINPAMARRITNAPDILSPTQGAYLADLAAGTTSTLRPTQTAYLVDKDAGQIAVPTASYAQTFTLTIQTTSAAGVVTTQTVTLTVPKLSIDNANNPTGYAGNWFATQDTTAGGTALPLGPWTSVTLTRPFQYMGVLPSPTATTVFTADPYQYCLDADNIDTGVNMGVLAFNPTAGGQNGIAPLQAQVSYQTLNWHVLHENLDVSDGGGTLKLVLDHLKRVGDVQFDGTTFGGLTGGTDNTNEYDLMLLDRDTGAFYGLNVSKNYTAIGSGIAAPAPSVDIVDNGDTLNNGDIQINYAGGRITLPAAFAGKHLRVFYSGDADWAVAVQKAPSVYTQTTDVSQLSKILPSSTPNLFYIPTAGSARIYFPACDSGKTVELDSVSCSVMDKSGAAQTRQATLVSQPISDTADATGYSVDLGSLGANIIQKDDKQITNLKVGGVRGVSVRAVVIWHERNTWHTRATDTLLTRSR